jgi:hypothetical protein
MKKQGADKIVKFFRDFEIDRLLRMVNYEEVPGYSTMAEDQAEKSDEETPNNGKSEKSEKQPTPAPVASKSKKGKKDKEKGNKGKVVSKSSKADKDLDFLTQNLKKLQK